MNNHYGRKNIREMSPSDVKFTQDSVGLCFQNGEKLSSTCEEIAKGNLKVANFPFIRVRNLNGICYSVDNRRLYVFRVLNKLGILPTITVKCVDHFEREFTTENNGCHVKVRSRKNNNNRWERVEIFRHCCCQQEKNRPLPNWWSPQWKCHVTLVNIAREKQTQRLHSANIARRNDFAQRSITVTPRLYDTDSDVRFAGFNEAVERSTRNYEYPKSIQPSTSIRSSSRGYRLPSDNTRSSTCAKNFQPTTTQAPSSPCVPVPIRSRSDSDLQHIVQENEEDGCMTQLMKLLCCCFN